MCSVFPPREKAQFLIPERVIGIMTPLFLSSLPLHITFTHPYIKLCVFCVCVCVCVCLFPFSIKRIAAALDGRRESKSYATSDFYTFDFFYMYVCVCACVCLYIYIYFSAVKRLIASKIRFCLHNMCVCAV